MTRLIRGERSFASASDFCVGHQNMIGLKRHTVQVLNHHPEWLTMAEDSCWQIWSSCQKIVVDVQHVGSTSVPGLPAKPILDIAIGVCDPSDIDDLRKRLEKMGYIYRGLGTGSIGHLFVRESAPGVRTEHVHVVLVNSPHWNDYIGFRDILRATVAIRDQYACLKQELAGAFANDRKRYTSGKHRFIQSILRTDAQQ